MYAYKAFIFMAFLLLFVVYFLVQSPIIAYFSTRSEGCEMILDTNWWFLSFLLFSLQLPPAPPPPSFPEGYVPQPTTEEEKGPETQQGGEPQLPTVDPIIDQGPAKRMKFWKWSFLYFSR